MDQIIEVQNDEECIAQEIKDRFNYEVIIQNDKYYFKVDLMVTDNFKIEVTRNLDPYSWIVVTNLGNLLKKERKWAIFEDSKDVFNFLFEQLKSENFKT